MTYNRPTIEAWDTAAYGGSDIYMGNMSSTGFQYGFYFRSNGLGYKISMSQEDRHFSYTLK